MVFNSSHLVSSVKLNHALASFGFTRSIRSGRTLGVIGLLTAIATTLSLMPSSALALDPNPELEAIAVLSLEPEHRSGAHTPVRTSEHLQEWLSLVERLSQATHAMSEPDLKAHLLLNLAPAYGALGAEEESVRVIQTALANVDDIEDDWQRAMMLGQIAQTIIDLEKTPQTEDLLGSVITMTRATAQDSGDTLMLEMVSQWGREYFDPQQAIALLEANLSTAYSLGDPRTQLTALGNVAKAYNEFGYPQRSAELLEAALRQVSTIENDSCKLCEFRALLKIANTLESPYRQDILDYAFNVVGTITSPQYQAGALVEMASAYGELGRDSIATPLLNAAVITANDLTEPLAQSNLLVEIANVYSDLNYGPQTSALLDRSLAIAAQIDDQSQQIGQLMNIAVAYDASGNSTKMTDTLNLAIAIAGQNMESMAISSNLYRIAASASQLSHESHRISMLNSLIATIPSLDDPQSQATVLRAVVRATEALDTEQQKVAMLTDSIAVAQTLELDQQYKTEFMGAIASVAEQINDPQQAAQLIQVTLPLAHSNTATKTNDMAWYNLASLIYAIQGLPEQQFSVWLFKSCSRRSLALVPQS